MPLIDLQCHFGRGDSTLAVRPPELAEASAYAAQAGVELLAFSSNEAVIDLQGGNGKLAQALSQDARFRGWLSLSVHQPQVSHELARQYLTRPLWLGSRFEQQTDADAVNTAGGHEVLNGLRRYSRPVVLTVTSPATLAAAIEAAREFHSLRFLLSPQDESMTTDTLPAVKETLNISLLPVAACTERDALALAVATLGERRVLWGSGWGRYHQWAALGMLRDSGIPPATRERIAYRNAQELIS